MGRVSFSAYLLHFAILRLFEAFPDELHTHATGISAICAFAVGWAVTILITYVASWAIFTASYRTTDDGCRQSLDPSA